MSCWIYESVRDGGIGEARRIGICQYSNVLPQVRIQCVSTGGNIILTKPV